MIYLTVIWKNPDEVNIPNPDEIVDTTNNITAKQQFVTDQTNYKNDFETNYKSLVTKIETPLVFDSEVSYDDFKQKIDGTTVTWSDVRMLDMPEAYYLYVNA